MAKPRSGKIKAVRFKTYAGTPNHLEEADHETESPAKGWLASKLKARLKWAETYSWQVRDELAPVVEAVSKLNLRDAKVGRSWRWEVRDDVSKVVFVFQLDVVA